MVRENDKYYPQNLKFIILSLSLSLLYLGFNFIFYVISTIAYFDYVKAGNI
ncbi:hypothetical protein LguiA_010133 [Lonicera macranthoides]